MCWMAAQAKATQVRWNHLSWTCATFDPQWSTAQLWPALKAALLSRAEQNINKKVTLSLSEDRCCDLSSCIYLSVSGTGTAQSLCCVAFSTQHSLLRVTGSLTSSDTVPPIDTWEPPCSLNSTFTSPGVLISVSGTNARTHHTAWSHFAKVILYKQLKHNVKLRIW